MTEDTAKNEVSENSTSKMTNNFTNSSNFITFLYKWRMHLFIIALAAIILSVIFSSPWFITPEFKASVVMFPTSSNAISQALLAQNPSAKNNILEFGDEDQAEQLLQILYSNGIRSRIIKKYDLMKHYGIDSTAKYKMTKLYNEYKDNISFKRNEFMAVEVDVYDKDPQYAANIANDIASLVDTVKNNIEKERAKYGLKIVRNDYNKMKNQIQIMEDSLDFIRRMGVYDYETQSEMLIRQYAMEVARNNRTGINALQKQLDILAKYGGPYVSMTDALKHLRLQFSNIQAKYEEAKVDAEEKMPQKFVVDYAYKPEKKSYPVRWLIVVVTTFSALLLGIIVIIVQDIIRKAKSSEI